MIKRTFELGMYDCYGNDLPDDPHAWTDDELGAALIDPTLRHAARRLYVRGKRHGLELSERTCVASLIRIWREDHDVLARRAFWASDCVFCRARNFAPPAIAERLAAKCTTCIPF